MVAATQGPGTELTGRRRRGLVVAVLLGIVAVLIVVAGFAALAMVGVKGELERGQRGLQDARRALVNGNVDEAAASFREASEAFAAGQRRSTGLAARAGSWLPFAGNNVDVGAGLARAGTDVAAAGEVLTEAVASLPEGLGSLAPTDGQIPVDDVATLAGPLGEAADRADAAATTVASTPDSFLVAPVAEARWEAIDEIGDAAAALDAADALLGELPAFAGADGTRRYLVASENPAELRGTGGIWGAYAILTLANGDASFSGVRSIQELPAVDAADVPPPSPDYERNYAEFGGAGSWQNLNMTPDFPTAARAALGAFEVVTGRRYDGMIVADPFALELMLRVTGPAAVPGTDITLSADDVVDFTTNEAYSIFDRAIERKEVLGTVAIDVIERFLDLEGQGIARVRALAVAAAGGHLKVYSEDDAFERGLALASADAAHGAPSEGDLVGVHTNDATGSKINFYETRSIDHTVTLGGDGEAVATTVLRRRNDAPTRGQPRYVIGPFADGLHRGDQRALVTFSCHDPCTRVASSADGAPLGLVEGDELGVPWLRDFGTIRAGDSRTVEVTTRTEDVWEGNGSGGVYRLTYLGQPTIRPTDLAIAIEPPEGTEIVWTSEPMSIEEGVATWEGEAPTRMDLEVRFRAPLPLRWWRNVLRPFGGL